MLPLLAIPLSLSLQTSSATTSYRHPPSNHHPNPHSASSPSPRRRQATSFRLFSNTFSIPRFDLQLTPTDIGRSGIRLLRRLHPLPPRVASAALSLLAPLPRLLKGQVYGEFWLPPQFLTDNDILMDFNEKTHNGNVSKKNWEADSFGPYCNSYLSSPVESVVRSTDTESGEDEYLAGLTRQLARFDLLDDLLKPESALGYENPKPWAMAGSPLFTVSAWVPVDVVGSSSSYSQPI